MEGQKDCKLKFSELKENGTYYYFVFKLSADDKQIVVENVGKPTQSFEDFITTLPDRDCRYVVYDHVTSKDDSEKRAIVFLTWAPDGAKTKYKMIYTIYKDTLRRELDGFSVKL
ncbi:hypothetical protein TIFTF001_000505 [Ficus carica]|uniref:ADF-H domain-containing protein n=1 Tax=Ficus carica TaxID=3494 RepID=A0AA87ZGI0_FICCA|nr:hypothetical protein TIFTF001_000505 [Ficus carica]